ncbi:helix-turn-helix domain-containing protein [Sphingomonas morindae]|uniref:Short-chain fatty acyl-CoA regulator family protein n=1 Tax=Sphingomonas morindae TaxID=1541170 RepID=A0ABY4X4Y5_9SPHN|nr:short-chain fatty acyl-CoA regulator family protein [Sphingomonas morindae]USI71963.1 short-chain fatty acyl-CoA regulator family protein [Sphingomonas morindae]
MTAPADRKLYLGPRLRVLRRELGLNQTRMAEELGVSPSYLNHLERNQRPLTAQMLLRLAHTYDIDVRDFVAGAQEAAASDLHHVFSDALVRDIGIPRQEILEVAENYPSVAEAVSRLYRALCDLRQMPDRIERLGVAAPVTASPLEWLRQAMEARHAYLAELDQAAETLAAALGETSEALAAGLVRRLGEAHGIGVRVVAEDVLAGTLRHYDPHRRRLLLSERLPLASRNFAIAYQLAQQALAAPLSATLERLAPPDAEAAQLARVALGNYAAAALLLPYGRFHRAAEALGYDPDRLARRFGASYEQIGHRLATLARPNARGLPILFLKVDAAGTIVKRVAGEAGGLARFGGGCARWHIHRAFRLPGEPVAQRVEMPDGQTYVTLARAVPRAGGEGLVAIVLACEARHADRLAWAAGLSGAPTPIGPACAVCERPACPERALPPVMRALDLSPVQRPIAPYPFRAT